MEKMFRLTLFLSVSLLALFLRIYKPAQPPFGFFCDEASVGYNAYSILTKGVDEYGIHLPIFFRAFGEYKGPVQIYTTVPLIALLGLSEFSVRLTSIIFGTLSILAIWLLAQELFKNHKRRWPIAFLAAFFLATSPWHLHFSRVALEGLMPFVFLTTTGLYLFLRAQKQPKILILSVLIFSLAVYSYFPARIFIPLLGLGIFLIYFRFFKENARETAVGLILLTILILPMAKAMLTPVGWSRWQQVSIFSQPPKNGGVVEHVVDNYLSHFSPDFLFFKGDIGMPGQFITRHSVRGVGELYLFQLPLILAGLFSLLRTQSKKPFSLLALWLILYPLGSAFTLDQSAQATRSIIGVVPFQIISAIGLVYLIGLIKKTSLRKIIIAVTAVIIIVSFQNYFQKYFVEYPRYSSDFWGWQYGPREIIGFFKENQKAYDDLIMTGSFNAPGIFFKFYAPGNCSHCQIGGLDKIDPRRRQLFALRPEEIKISKNAMIIKKEIFYPNQDLAFVIFEIRK